jgi:STE24 endopeptidase
MFLSSLIGFWLLGWLSDQSWFYSGLGVNQSSNAAALMLFLLVSPVFTFFLSPISAYFSRKQEFQADDFAVDQTSGEMMIHALLKLYQENANTLTPDPLYSAFYDSHPPAPVRIAHIDSRIN